MSYQHSKCSEQQRGVVIVVALFIVALVAVMAYSMIARLERDTYRTTLILRNAEAEYIAQASVDWARDALKNNYAAKDPNRVVDKIPIMSPVMKENGFTVVSTITDMQARYNLNNLTGDNKDDFVRMLIGLLPKLPKKQATDIVDAIINWINPGSNNDAMAKYYLNLPVPYRVRHAPMFNASELRLVKGVTPQIFAALQPYITALPRGATLNVQTMPAAVMLTLSPSMTLAAGKTVEVMRQKNPPVTKDAFLKIDVIHNHKIDGGKLTDMSEYFLVETKVTIEKQPLLIYTLLKRTIKDKKAEVEIVWQSKGSW